MELKERVSEYCNLKNIAISKFESLAGLSNGYFNNIKKRPSLEKIESISRAFPDLNTAWLMTGEGEMLKNEGNSSPVKGYLTGVPYYNVDFIGGFDLVLNDQTVTPEYLIDFQQYNKSTCWCNITGHSMEPEIASGDIIALKQIGPTERHGLGGRKTRYPLFPDLSQYWCRHTWATMAAELDIPKETIAAGLGHGGNTVTDIYIRFDQKKVDDANRRIIDYLLQK